MFIKNENASNDWKQRAKMQIFVGACVCVCVCMCVTESASRKYEKYGCQLHNKTVLGSVLKVQSGSSLVVQ